MNDVLNAIAVCDKFLFERAMHRLQDNWTHYAKGFRSTWFHDGHPKHWGAIYAQGHFQIAIMTHGRKRKTPQKRWQNIGKSCCQGENKNWYPKVSGCFEK